MKFSSKPLETDVLVIGAGGAGLRAAIEAKKAGVDVLILAKEPMGEAHTSMAMGGLNVAIKKPATAKQHFDDTIKGGWHINNHKLVKIFAKEMPDRIYDLESYGVKFDRLPDGSFYTWAGGKQSAPLNLCAGDYTGREIIEGLVREIKRLKIPFLQNHFVTRLLTYKKAIVGAVVLDLEKEELHIVMAKVTIVATGGAGMLYLVNTNAPTNTGEGYSMALAAGAELVDMEMVQFHPTGMVYPERKRGALITEKVRGHGGMLKNKNGERFMAKYQPQRMELAGRDEVARAIFQEVEEGRGTKHGGVYLDVTHWKKGEAEKLIPEVLQEHKDVGIDIRRQMMEVYPSMHHMMGGINIDEWGKTKVERLYAVGEATRNIHGANRLGGNSLAEGQVFGRRVGLHAAKAAKKAKLEMPDEQSINNELRRLNELLKNKGRMAVSKLVLELKTIMWQNAGLIRDEKRLKRALREVKRLQKAAKKLRVTPRTLRAALELIEMLKIAEMIIVPALLRRESRGAHYRTDYPEINPRWEKNIVITQAKGTLKTKIVSVVK